MNYYVLQYEYRDSYIADGGRDSRTHRPGPKVTHFLSEARLFTLKSAAKNYAAHWLLGKYWGITPVAVHITISTPTVA